MILSELTHKLASILRDEFPQQLQSVPQLTQSHHGTLTPVGLPPICATKTTTSRYTKTTKSTAEGGDNSSILNSVNEISMLIRTIKLALEHEKELMLVCSNIEEYYQKFTSFIDFSCMRTIEMGDIDISSAKILGFGCNGTTSSVMLKPTNDWHIPRKIIEQGVTLRKMCLVSSETGKPVDSTPHNHRECVSIYDRTTFITQELGSVTLEKHMQQAELPTPSFSQQQNRSAAATKTDTTTSSVLPLGMDKTLESTFQLLSTVDHLNNTCGLFHMDIKSDNILFLERAGFTGQFTVLCDFGTSVSINPSSSVSDGGSSTGGVTPGMLELGQNEVPEGNILNRAPETLRPVSLKPRSSSTYNVSKTDLWAVGCVVWQMCTGTTPFTSEEAITSKPLTIPAGLLSECPCLFHLLKRVFDRNPATRPSAGLASIFVGSHLFLPYLNDIVTRIKSPAPAPAPTPAPAPAPAPASPRTPTSTSAAASNASSPPSSVARESGIEQSLCALKSQTCAAIDALMEQQKHLEWKERTIPVRLFLQLVFLHHATPALILLALNTFSP
ncbi:hypothetical protein Pelo_7843 [Pelomyxa schiedti]|nr:hypothetical protein Pelo_7843 [Pelomyxa schiedti]